ncbi:MAG: ABC transporter permease [Chloroflexi bacterium]|jgi:peptide/nickel transport system permease protein|nr:ABC transporter permease [Chloroflexota bacterium]MBT4142368.1 ABC transporter permease [Chloroflexota bacterium]MBT6708116.1 ABC transporter permease [Chloroflexota bacterium]MBT7078253.1 ABC transporter permease [Chloroflexota bacterium]MBT7467336.1 ABC transporter permease [Chloroflexota bacterium]
MRRFIIRRFVFSLVSIVIATLAVFLLSRAQGDPLLLYATSGYGLTAESEAALRKKLALDRPVPVQYALWLGRTLKGDMGETILDRKPVARVVLARLPSTLHLGAAAFFLSFLVGIPLGVLSAVKRGTIWDYIGRFFALLGQAVPQFWLGLVLIMLFAVNWQIFPAGLKGEGLWDVKYLVLPTITLASSGFAFYMRITRTAMLEVLDSEYVRLSRAKGVGNNKVIWKHAFKNAFIQPLTGMTLGLTFFLTGSVLVETIFAWPGMGQMAITAVNNNDFPVLQGVVFFFTILFVGMTFITDLLYAYIDPRIRYD